MDGGIKSRHDGSGWEKLFFHVFPGLVPRSMEAGQGLSAGLSCGTIDEDEGLP